MLGFNNADELDPDRGFAEQGLDSLMAVRIRNTTRADFGIEPPVAMILQGASLQDLTVDVIRQLGLAEPEQNLDRGNAVRDRAQQRAAARQGAALRRKRGQ